MQKNLPLFYKFLNKEIDIFPDHQMFLCEERKRENVYIFTQMQCLVWKEKPGRQ